MSLEAGLVSPFLWSLIISIPSCKVGFFVVVVSVGQAAIMHVVTLCDRCATSQCMI